MIGFSESGDALRGQTTKDWTGGYDLPMTPLVDRFEPCDSTSWRRAVTRAAALRLGSFAPP